MTPLVITVILIILGNNVEYVSDTSKYTFSENLKGLVQLLISGILLLYAPAFASSLLDGRGNIMIGNKITQVATSVIMDLGLSAITRWITRFPEKAFNFGTRGLSTLFKGDKAQRFYQRGRGKKI